MKGIFSMNASSVDPDQNPSILRHIRPQLAKQKLAK